MLNPVNKATQDLLCNMLETIENTLGGDFVCMYGPIEDGLERVMLHLIEELADDGKKKDILYVMLTTYGGNALVVERIVNIFRNHYTEVNFIVPDYAYSAGTVLCMSGDNIYMDYYSALGPIDPQIQNKDQKWVPALGYLDKINELLEKAKSNTLTEAEFLILRDFDLAEIRAYEQARELTIDLLKKWLVKYKFKNWSNHKNGDTVTLEQKESRASEIAAELNNYGRWKSHGRPINMETLTELKLKIEDYGQDSGLSHIIREYYMTMRDFAQKNGLSAFLHSRRFI